MKKTLWQKIYSFFGFWHYYETTSMVDIEYCIGAVCHGESSSESLIYLERWCGDNYADTGTISSVYRRC